MKMAKQTLVFIGIYLYLLLGIDGLSFSGCFTLPPGFTTPTDVAKLGWGDNWDFDQLSLQFCVNHCANKQKKYAALMTTSTKTQCLCGSEEAFKKLGKPDHTVSQSPCHHPIWSMRTYVALNDFSTQYIGCYKEVADEKNMASNTHNWIDTWMMNPSICIRYCENNGAGYASLRKGDTCTCSMGFAKHGKTDEKQCNMPCAGSTGTKCGGSLANSVFSTLSGLQSITYLTAIDEIIQPDTSVTSHSFKPANPVSVPNTQVLVKSLLDLQTAVSKQIPNKEAKDIGDMLFSAETLVGQILEMNAAVDILLQSPGFGMSNAPDTVQWVNGQFPADLQPFADVIKRSQSFVSKDIKKLKDMISGFMAKSGPLKKATAETLTKLKNYFANGILITGIDETIRVAQMMVSASKHCVPRLRGNRDIMTKDLEHVSQTLIEGPFGTITYIRNLQNPFASAKRNKVSAPKIDTKALKTGLTDTANAWASFVQNNGFTLYQLIMKKYSVGTPCPTSNPNSVVGKRSVCQAPVEEDFLTLVAQAGDNPAKADMQKFVKEKKVLFDAFKWSTLEGKLKAVSDSVKIVEKYLKDAQISTDSEIKKLATPLTSFKFYQTCVKYMSNLLHDVCHTSSTRPIASKVIPIKC